MIYKKRSLLDIYSFNLIFVNLIDPQSWQVNASFNKSENREKFLVIKESVFFDLDNSISNLGCILD